MLCCSLLYTVAFCAAEPTTASITAYGRYTGELTSEVPTSDKTSGGVIIKRKNVEHFETTAVIPCRLNEIWGVTVKFQNLPADRPFKLKNVMHHPPIKQPNGETLTTSVRDRIVSAGNDPSGHFTWSFVKGYEYELVPGKWTRKIYIDDVEVASMTFDIIK